MPDTASKNDIKPVRMHEIINPRIEPIDENDCSTNFEGCHSVRLVFKLIQKL